MIECPVYITVPSEDAVADPPVDDVVGCTSCNCGYIQYESLIPYLKEIRDAANITDEDHIDFEFKLRELIVEVSRIFDISAGVSPGYFSKAHYFTTRIYPTRGSRYMKIPEHVEGTLELRTLDDLVIDPSYYGYENNHLVFLPCYNTVNCQCTAGCGVEKSPTPIRWPDSCYKVSAKWGKECSDMAVQKAVRDYLIETFRMQDPVIQTANGISIQRRFTVPHSWEVYIKNFKDKRKIFSNFAIA